MGRAGKKELCADPEFDELAERWNANLSDCMGDMTQGKFADLLNEAFANRTSFTQPVINSWLSVSRDQMFPRFEIMARMADILGVGVSRLTGETSFDSIPAQTTSEHTGLSNEAIRSLRKITREFGSPFAGKYLGKDEFNEGAVQIVNSMLTSAEFLPVLKAMRQLADTIERTRIAKEAALKRVEEEHGETAFKKAMALITSRDLYLIEEDETIHDYWVNNEAALSREGILESELLDLFEIAGKIEVALDDAYVKDQNGEMWDLACRYQARAAFDRLLDDMFPSDYQTR